MATYDYKFIETGEIIEVSHPMKNDALTEYVHPETGEMMKVKRLISGGSGFILKGDGWTASSKNRGYKGKFKNKLRPVGCPVENPNNKREADQFFQNQIDSGMLDNVQPSFSVAPQTTEQQLDPNYRPKFNP